MDSHIHHEHSTLETRPCTPPQTHAAAAVRLLCMPCHHLAALNPLAYGGQTRTNTRPKDPTRGRNAQREANARTNDRMSGRSTEREVERPQRTCVINVGLTPPFMRPPWVR